MSCLAFTASAYSPSIPVLMLTYGVLGERKLNVKYVCLSMCYFLLIVFHPGGFGLGLAYLPSVVCVGYYFEKRRALATGIAVCGSGNEIRICTSSPSRQSCEIAPVHLICLLQ